MAGPTFTSFPIESEYINNVASEEVRTGSMFFNRNYLQHINHGPFFRPLTNYSHCFWEAVVNPYDDSVGWTGYIVSDSEGGSHCMLFGVSAGGAGLGAVTGNMDDGTGLTSFTSLDSFPLNNWVHLAAGWDGSHIIVWVNGVLSNAIAWSPAQRKNQGGNNGVLFIGGSDHSNFWGNIAAVRAYEGYGRCAYLADFSPELTFRPISNDTGGFNVPQFCANYESEEKLYLDAGLFEGRPHHGVPEALQGTVGSNAQSGSFIGTGLYLPTFSPGVVEYGQHIPTAPTTPSGALIFDSFSRVDVTSLSPTNLTTGAISLGSTESGSLGVKTWTALDGSAAAGQGILNGYAYIFKGAAGSVVQTSTQDVDVRLDRMANSLCQTGMYVRYKDANDGYLVIASDTNVTVYKTEGGVATNVSYSVSSGWKTLRVTAVGTTFNVYVGTATEGTFTLAGSFTGTNVAGATKAGIASYNHFDKQVWRYDNFLVKAG